MGDILFFLSSSTMGEGDGEDDGEGKVGERGTWNE
jgi:hypothetical protein